MFEERPSGSRHRGILVEEIAVTELLSFFKVRKTREELEMHDICWQRKREKNVFYNITETESLCQLSFCLDSCFMVR